MKLRAFFLSKLVLIQLLAIGASYIPATLRNSLQYSQNTVHRLQPGPSFTFSLVKYEHYEAHFAIPQDFVCTLANVIAFLSCEYLDWTPNASNC